MSHHLYNQYLKYVELVQSYQMWFIKKMFCFPGVLHITKCRTWTIEYRMPTSCWPPISINFVRASLMSTPTWANPSWTLCCTCTVSPLALVVRYYWHSIRQYEYITSFYTINLDTIDFDAVSTYIWSIFDANSKANRLDKIVVTIYNVSLLIAFVCRSFNCGRAKVGRWIPLRQQSFDYQFRRGIPLK